MVSYQAVSPVLRSLPQPKGAVRLRNCSAASRVHCRRGDNKHHYRLLIACLFGRYVLKTCPVLLTGAGRWLDCKRCGTRVSLRGTQKPQVPTLGYTGAYVFANVLLTMASSAILLLYGAGRLVLCSMAALVVII